MKTVAEAKEEFFDALVPGSDPVDCPCCNRHAEVHRRTISAIQARSLQELERLGGRERFVDRKDLAKALAEVFPDVADPLCDWGSLTLWGVIVNKSDRPEHLSASGKWMLTKRGLRFLRGDLRLPRHCWELFMVPQEFSEETASIDEALGKRRVRP